MSVHPSIAAGLLAWAAATDNREVTESAAIAWADALDDRVTITDGKAAITAHRAASGDWLMPSHVNAGVRKIRRDRLENAGTPQPPTSLDGHTGREKAWRLLWQRAIGDGHTTDEAVTIACADLGVDPDRPVINPAKRPPELAALTHGRQCECGCLTRPIRPEEGAA